MLFSVDLDTAPTTTTAASIAAVVLLLSSRYCRHSTVDAALLYFACMCMYVCVCTCMYVQIPSKVPVLATWALLFDRVLATHLLLLPSSVNINNLDGCHFSSSATLNLRGIFTNNTIVNSVYSACLDTVYCLTPQKPWLHLHFTANLTPNKDTLRTASPSDPLPHHLGISIPPFLSLALLSYFRSSFFASSTYFRRGSGLNPNILHIFCPTTTGNTFKQH